MGKSLNTPPVWGQNVVVSRVWRVWEDVETSTIDIVIGVGKEESQQISEFADCPFS